MGLSRRMFTKEFAGCGAAAGTRRFDGRGSTGAGGEPERAASLAA